MNIDDLAFMCGDALSIAQIFEYYASNLNMPTDEPARSETENILSAMRVITGMLQKINDLAEELDTQYWKQKAQELTKTEEGAKA